MTESERVIMQGRDKIMAFLAGHNGDLERRFSVKAVGLFGSVLRGEDTDTSDVDILVELAELTFDRYMDLKFFLEEHLKRPVDVVLKDSLKPRIKPIIIGKVIYA